MAYLFIKFLHDIAEHTHHDLHAFGYQCDLLLDPAT
jgi:hypothetical protein